MSKIYYCQFFAKENAWGRSKINKFCDNKCQGQYVWNNVTIPRIESGPGATAKTLKRYLTEKNGYLCSECGITDTWNNKKLVLQLDHIDGNSDNNNLTNIRLLCLNCHSQTESFGSKGKGNRYKKVTKRNTYLQQYKGSLV